MLLYIVGSSLRIVRWPEKIIFIKGPVYILYINLSAFTAHLPLKVLDFFKVLSLACSVLWNYCIFANNFWKYRQLLTCKNPDICMLNYVLCSFALFLPCKTLSKYGAHSQIQPSTKKLCTASFWCEPASFKVQCMLNPILWRNPALLKTNNVDIFLCFYMLAL